MKSLITLFIAAVVVIVGLSIYLAPNDLTECDNTPDDTAACHPADAIVAISGGDTNARASEAIKLYQAGWAQKLIFSGAAQDKSGPSNAQVMRQLALEMGVPAGDIITENEGETTKQNAEKSQTIFQEYNISSVILVTSSYHQRRASLEFNKRSADVAVRNHPVARDNQWAGTWWWLTPTGWYLAVSEFGKIIAFYAGGTR